MDSFYTYLNNIVNNNREIFSEYTGINWLNPYQAVIEQEKRELLIIKQYDNWLFKGTKPYYKQLSKGCMFCGLGVWSCLFITGKCNANCFYCPTSQLTDDVPSSQNLHFETAESYAEYINHFRFKAVSFSGGEPLLFFDRTLNYLKQIRKKCSPEIYIWMYTNGIFAAELKLKKLAAAGLNEIRFDIGADNYKLDKIKFAKGIFQNITIEIPAIPEEKERIKQLLPEMTKAGVTNLNLHQLRLTKHNVSKLLKHNYTYIHAEQPIVLESELAALEILDFARSQKLNIGVNYCSFFFKNRFQKAGFRKQIANVLADPNEIITEKGFIREYNGKEIGYKALVISDNTESSPNTTVLGLKHKTFITGRETALKPISIDADSKMGVDELLKKHPTQIPRNELQFKIWQMEYIENGLREY